MKKISIKITPYVFGCMLIVGMSSCGGNSNANTDADSTATGSRSDTGQDLQSNASNTGDKMKGAADSLGDKVNAIFSGNNPDSSFVLNAGTQNEDEIKLLQAGIDKGTNAELKAHAKMMLADHKKLGTEVKAYAAKKKYSTFSSADSKASDELSDLNKNKAGKDWDKAWADKLVDGHEKTINLFEKGQSNVKDPVLNGMITKTLPTLHSHLTMVQGVQTSLK